MNRDFRYADCDEPGVLYSFPLAPMVNAVLAWAAMLDLIGRVISVAVDGTGSGWCRLGRWAGFPCSHSGAGFGLRFRHYLFPVLQGVREKQLLQQEAEEAQRNGEEEKSAGRLGKK